MKLYKNIRDLKKLLACISICVIMALTIPIILDANLRGDFVQEVTLNKFQKMRRTVAIIKTDKGLGSAVAVTDRGLLVTNKHVIDNANYIMVDLNNKNYVGRVVFVHPNLDIAFLKIKPKKKTIHHVKINPELPEYGDVVYSLGSPLGVKRFLSRGVVSKLTLFNGAYPLIFTDAFITNGSSGGGLFNEDGELVGITTWTRLQRRDEKTYTTSIHIAISTKNISSLINLINKL